MNTRNLLIEHGDVVATLEMKVLAS